MNTWKRILAVLLAVAMLASFGFAGAADEEVEGEPELINETEGTPVEDATEAETAEEPTEVVAEPECPFEDIEDEDVIEAVMSLYHKGITNGTSETTFEPEKTLDRAEFMTLLGRVFRAEVDQDAETGFTDVINDGWSQGYIAWGVEHGLIEGYGDGTFGQYDTLTKEQVNIIIGRLAGVSVGGTGFTPFEETEGNPTRAEIAVLLNAGMNSFMYKLFLPKTDVKYLSLNDYKAWGELPPEGMSVQGIGGSSTDTTAALELYEECTFTNPDENAEDFVKTMKYFVYDPVKNGADPEGKYPVLVWFHGKDNAVQNDHGKGVIGPSGATLFATEAYQEAMGTPCYVIVPVANEEYDENGATLHYWRHAQDEDGNSIYAPVLHALITSFMEENADNVSTLHINGTSSGGYMAWNYTITYADEITSTFLMAPHYEMDETNVDEMLETTKNIQILHIHAKHDELVPYNQFVAPIEEKLNEAENYTLAPFEWVCNRDGAVFSLSVGIEMGQHCICNQALENLMFADGTPMNELIPNGLTGWYKTVFEAAE